MSADGGKWTVTRRAPNADPPSRFTVVHCERCGHQWDLFLPLPIEIKRAVLIMRAAVAAGCPGCLAHGPNVVRFGPAPGAHPEKDRE